MYVVVFFKRHLYLAVYKRTLQPFTADNLQFLNVLPLQATFTTPLTTQTFLLTYFDAYCRRILLICTSYCSKQIAADSTPWRHVVAGKRLIIKLFKLNALPWLLHEIGTVRNIEQWFILWNSVNTLKRYNLKVTLLFIKSCLELREIYKLYMLQFVN